MTTVNVIQNVLTIYQFETDGRNDQTFWLQRELWILGGTQESNYFRVQGKNAFNVLENLSFFLEILDMAQILFKVKNFQGYIAAVLSYRFEYTAEAATLYSLHID